MGGGRDACGVLSMCVVGGCGCGRDQARQDTHQPATLPSPMITYIHTDVSNVDALVRCNCGAGAACVLCDAAPRVCDRSLRPPHFLNR